ncbi:MAG TPA: hypothetical protein VI386_36805, partial [Candidatus Sulfotelmatobacter sp.]
MSSKRSWHSRLTSLYRGRPGRARLQEVAEKHFELARDELQADMRGREDQQEDVFSYIPLEKRVPQDHPLRR